MTDVYSYSNRQTRTGISLANLSDRQVVPMFEQEEDAERYVYLIDECTDPMAPELDVIEIEKDAIIKACKSMGHDYVVYSEDDLIIPPLSL